MKIKIYHNPRCSKSRAGLEALENSKLDFEVVKYLDEIPSVGEIEELLELLDMEPIELVRTKESIWKEEFKGKELSDEEIVLAMAEYPKLIERPIIINGDKAIIGRPAEIIHEFLNS